MARTVGIGIQDFGKIIQNNCFYVDKTAFIKEWWENQDDVTLITRPRRFGKTLAMSMLEHFFSVEHADKGTLFERLDIWKEEKYRSLQGSYPVIFLSFADVKETSFGSARDKICRIIKSVYDRYSALQDKGPNQRKFPDIFHEISPTMGDSVASYSLKALSEFLADYYGKRVIIFRIEGRAEEIIETGHEFGLSDDDILGRLQRKLDISLEKAQRYLKELDKRTV